MKQAPIQSNPCQWKALVVGGVLVAGAVIVVVSEAGAVRVATVALRGSDSGDRAAIIKAAAEFNRADSIIKAAAEFIKAVVGLIR